MSDDDEIHLTDAEAAKVRQIAREVGATVYEETRADGDTQLHVWLDPENSFDDFDDSTPPTFCNYSEALAARTAEIQQELNVSAETALAIAASGTADKETSAEAQREIISRRTNHN